MTRNDEIRASLRRVVGNYGESLGRTWQYRRMTSSAAAEPRTYSAEWVDFVALDTTGSFSEVFDQDRGEYKKAWVQRLRAADDDPSPWLCLGSQVKDPDGNVWAVVGVQSSGIGTVAYSLTKDVGRKGGPDRKDPV